MEALMARFHFSGLMVLKFYEAVDDVNMPDCAYTLSYEGVKTAIAHAPKREEYPPHLLPRLSRSPDEDGLLRED